MFKKINPFLVKVFEVSIFFKKFSCFINLLQKILTHFFNIFPFTVIFLSVSIAYNSILPFHTVNKIHKKIYNKFSEIDKFFFQMNVKCIQKIVTQKIMCLILFSGIENLIYR